MVHPKDSRSRRIRRLLSAVLALLLGTSSSPAWARMIAPSPVQIAPGGMQTAVGGMAPTALPAPSGGLGGPGTGGMRLRSILPLEFAPVAPLSLNPAAGLAKPAAVSAETKTPAAAVPQARPSRPNGPPRAAPQAQTRPKGRALGTMTALDEFNRAVTNIRREPVRAASSFRTFFDNGGASGGRLSVAEPRPGAVSRAAEPRRARRSRPAADARRRGQKRARRAK
ncbi:MAG: hypothetical protein ABII00_05290, partial [Elusimicrobiota bacterium]